MKKVIAVFLVFVILLSGCWNRISIVTDPTSTVTTDPSTPVTASAPSSATTASPTTSSDPTIPPATSATLPPADPQTVAELTAKFSEPGSWYNMALTCVYASSKDLNLRMFFSFGGFKDESREPTDQEWEHLKDIPSFDINYDFYRLPVSKINAVLTEHFGITVEDLSEESFLGLQYLEDTDCYYYMDTGVHYILDFAVTKTTVLEDGTICLYYTIPYGKHFAVTLKPHDDNYWILSNLPA